MSHNASRTPKDRPETPNPWILGRGYDLVLFVATPLLVLPIVGLARAQVSAAQIALFVAAFGALGHHVPGLMRAYGDQALFERFRLRFILSPIFLLAVAIPSTVYELHGLTVVVLVWGVWHGALQVYGFLRIYDAKVRSFAKWTARLDWVVCIGWFGAGLLYSPGRMVSLVEAFYQGGGPLIATEGFHVFKTAWAGLTIASSIVFLGKFVMDWRSGLPVNPVKPLCMALSFGFWWYTAVVVQNAILGVALFEVFHDVQYLGIVWFFNRNRVESNNPVGTFTRFLFRRSGVMLGLYVGLCFGYGAFRFLPEVIAHDPVRKILIGVVAASTLLHFYFDGFIWKVRDKMTSEGLGLEGARSAEIERGKLAPWMAHGLKWSTLVIPIFVLAAAQLRGATPTFEQYVNMVKLIPDSAYLRNNYGFQLKARGRVDQALVEYEMAIALDPSYARARSNLGVALLQQGQVADAVEQLRQAVELDPDYAEAHTNLASALSRQNDDGQALQHYRTAVGLEPDLLEAHNGLGQALTKMKKPHEAVYHFERAVALDPDLAELRANLGLALAMAGESDEALSVLESALVLSPDELASLETSAWLLATRPNATEEDAARAVARGERAAELTSYLDASILDTLGVAYAAVGRFERAQTAARTASALASEAGNQAFVRDIERRIELYRRGEAFREQGGARP